MTELIPEQDSFLFKRMEEILEAVEKSLEAQGSEVPDRRYVTFGNTVHDCLQLTVSCVQVYLGPAGDQAEGPQPCNGPYTGVFQVDLVRTIPTGWNVKGRNAGPDADEMTEVTKGYAKDAIGLLETPQYLNEVAAIADVNIGEPSGGFVGITMNLVTGLY